MSAYSRISIKEAKDLIEAEATVVDIRDSQSYLMGHIEGASLLDNNTLENFIQNTSKESPVIVYCYHGNSSQQAGQYLVQQGFTQVFSMDGGFEEWKSCYPWVNS